MRKVLLVAPGCNPDDVGESWQAYHWARGLGVRNEVTLLTYLRRDRERITGRLPGVRIVEWRDLPAVGRAERLNSMLKPGYFVFYRRAHRWILNARARGEHFDIGHQVSPVALRYPSPLMGTGVPYVFGPAGGSLNSPPGFPTDDSAPWYLALRNLDHWRLRHDRWLRRTYSDAACFVGIAPYVKESLDGTGVKDFRVLADTGVESLPPAVDRSRRSGPVRLLFVGRLVRTKGAREAIRAMSHLRDLPVVLDIVGDGFDREPCENLIRDLDLGGTVTVQGKVLRREVDLFYRDADIFIFPSYREPGGNVVTEAMSFGLPSVVSTIGGPGATIDETVGIRVPPIDEEQYARDLATAVRRLVDDAGLRRALGANARRRIADVTLWDRKIEWAEALYDQVLERERPNA